MVFSSCFTNNFIWKFWQNEMQEMCESIQFCTIISMLYIPTCTDSCWAFDALFLTALHMRCSVWKDVHILYSKACAHTCALFPSVSGWHSRSCSYSNALRDGLTERHRLWSSVTGFHFSSSKQKLHNSEMFLCLCGKIINSDRNISVTKCPVVIAASAVLIITVDMCLFVSLNSLEIYFLFIFFLFLRLYYSYIISPFYFLPPNLPVYSSCFFPDSWPLFSFFY